MLILDPLRLYQIQEDVKRLKAAQLSPAAVGTNISVVTGVAGITVYVMGWIAQAVGAAAGSFQLKDASGGTFIHAPVFAPPVTAGAVEKLPIIHTPYFTLTNGNGLFVDIVTANINLTVFYL